MTFVTPFLTLEADSTFITAAQAGPDHGFPGESASGLGRMGPLETQGSPTVCSSHLPLIQCQFYPQRREAQTWGSRVITTRKGGLELKPS